MSYTHTHSTRQQRHGVSVGPTHRSSSTVSRAKWRRGIQKSLSSASLKAVYALLFWMGGRSDDDSRP